MLRVKSRYAWISFTIGETMYIDCVCAGIVLITRNVPNVSSTCAQEMAFWHQGENSTFWTSPRGWEKYSHHEDEILTAIFLEAGDGDGRRGAFEAFGGMCLRALPWNLAVHANLPANHEFVGILYFVYIQCVRLAEFTETQRLAQVNQSITSFRLT